MSTECTKIYTVNTESHTLQGGQPNIRTIAISNVDLANKHVYSMLADRQNNNTVVDKN